MHTHTRDHPRLLHAQTARHVLARSSLHTHAHRKAMHGTFQHSHMLIRREPGHPFAHASGCVYAPLHAHPYHYLPPVPRTHTTLVQSHFFTLVPSAGGPTHMYTSTLTHTHTCTHTTFTPQSLGPQLPRPRAAQPDGPGDSWWEKMSSGCSDGRLKGRSRVKETWPEEERGEQPEAGASAPFLLL